MMNSAVISDKKFRVTALAGGVGGAKLAAGLAACLPPSKLTVIVNIGDDFDHLGLRICPDLDTVCYALAGIANPATGWGRADESWHVYEEIVNLGGAGWFRLGDRDLATHIIRTNRLRQGEESLSMITNALCGMWGVDLTVLPASDDPIPTQVYTEEGILQFQEYFVEKKCIPKVREFRFLGIEHARPAPGVITAIRAADMVVICPSNPWVSIDPILAIPGISDEIRQKEVIAVSPIIAGETIKGPAAKMYRELGIVPSALAVAQHYIGLLSGFIFDMADAALENDIKNMGLCTYKTNTVMLTEHDRQKLAQEVIEFGIHLKAN